MRAGLSTIQQTLTPEASAVLNRAIAEAARRKHGQTTPLHVAAALLSSPASNLRQACLRSHPNPSSSHPLQCRALELCFSVALDRLPCSSAASPSPEDTPATLLPPISNALMAALKRAQAHQRRGCPESQQQPLLAVKVELDHLLLSILDDPSVSRVMREASFSSPAVKSSIESSLLSSPSPSPSPPPVRNIYASARLVTPSATPPTGDLAKVYDILTRAEKRNPILVGDADPGAVIREAVGKIGSADAPTQLRSVAIISAEKELAFSTLERAQIPSKIRNLTPVIEAQIGGGAITGVILDLGDLKWLVDGVSQQQSVCDVGRAAVAEMGRLLLRFRGATCATRLWLIGSATCATYLRCQVYFPTMESDWDLQAMPVAPRTPPLSGYLPRGGIHGLLNRKLESFSMPRGFPAINEAGPPPKRPPEILDSFCKGSLCNSCKESYELELAKLGDDDSKFEGSPESRKSLPRWLQMAAMPSSNLKNQEQDLKKKWRDSCSRLHRIPMPSKPPITVFSEVKPKSPEKATTLAGALIKTDLALGPAAPARFTSDATSIKRLVNGLLDKVSWQAEAASAVAAAIIQWNSGVGKRRNGSPKSDTWILLGGSDRVGKRKMALALSELVFGAPPLIVRLGSPAGDDAEESNTSFRGRTSMDRVAETLRANPFSAVFFEDLDRTDSALRGMLRRAMERGRLLDSHGREVGLGSTVFILTAGWRPEELGSSNEELRRSEERITELAASGRDLELQLEEKTHKRRHEWLFNDERITTKPRKDSFSLDLNLSAGAIVDEEAGEGSWNSSDLTVENGQEHGHSRLAMQPPIESSSSSSSTSEFIELIDATIVFKPVDFAPLRNNISDSVSNKFTQVMGKGLSISIDDDALDQISGGVWLGGDAPNLFDEWIERVLAPAVEQLRGNPKLQDGGIVRLSSAKTRRRLYRNYLPSSVKIAVGD